MKPYILTNAHILPLTDACLGFAKADSILVQDKIISAIGDMSQCRQAAKSTAEVIDLDGRVLLPAFCDSHTHFAELAKRRFQLNLSGCTQVWQIQDAAMKFREINDPLPKWILGDGWDANLLDHPQMLDRTLLDQLFPDVPAAIFSKDYHARWCNTLALKISGLLDASQSGFAQDEVPRDGNGLATGIIYEDATLHLQRYISQPSDAELAKAMRSQLSHIYSLGIGGFHTMEESYSANVLKALQAEGESFRLVWHFPLQDLDLMIENKVKSYQEQGSFIIGGVKLFLDGALGSRTAAMLQPYTGEEDNYGVLRLTEEDLASIIHKASSADIACTIHAIGDYATHLAIKHLNNARLTASNKRLLHRIEHLQAIAPYDLAMLEQSGIHCSLQPVHMAADIPLIQKHWRDTKHRCYRWADLDKCGIPFSFGSDAPIESINPFLGIYTAITRRSYLDPSLPAFLPHQALSVNKALWAYTHGAALGSGSQDWRGSLEVGKAADIIAINDWCGQPPEFFLQAKSHFTMVDGKINYIDI